MKKIQDGYVPPAPPGPLFDRALSQTGPDYDLAAPRVHGLIPDDYREPDLRRSGRSTRLFEKARLLYEYLRRHCVGLQNARTDVRIADDLGWYGGRKEKDRQTNIIAVKNVLIQQGYPVCSATGGKGKRRGMFLAATQQEIDAAVQYLEAMAAGLTRSADALRRTSPTQS